MLVGNKEVFAIESEIEEAYYTISLRALGFFVIYIGGKRYGLRKPDATMLAISHGEVVERIHRCGTHSVPFLDSANAREIAEAVQGAIYGDDETRKYFGHDAEEFYNSLKKNGVIWAPGGDAAFDDGGNVLQFDQPNGKVRLIGFLNVEEHGEFISSITETYMEADSFYGILEQWAKSFVSEWEFSEKVTHKVTLFRSKDD